MIAASFHESIVKMENILFGLNTGLFLIFTVFYLYQIIYVGVVLVKKPVKKPEGLKHRYAVLISARNEENVISGLLDSLKNQKYPDELIDVYVVADNCSDNTAQIARSKGVYVYERHNKSLTGKSHALNFLLEKIFEEQRKYDGFFVFDADNVLDENFIVVMNDEFAAGSRIVTSYRNAKNYGSSWISAGHALWFLREAKWLSQARCSIGSSCMVSGTGFLISSEILEQQGGWKHHLLTEDIEFSIDMICQGEKIGYAPNAIVYDEQPITMKESWNQRLRWAKGFYQVLRQYWRPLMTSAFKERNFSSYDALCTIAPAMLLTITGVVVNVFFAGVALANPSEAGLVFEASITALFFSMFNFCAMLFVFAIITTISEWKNIYAPTHQKIGYLFTFPLFMLTYVPIALIALVSKVEWKPIAHSVVRSPSEIKAAIRQSSDDKIRPL